MPAGGGAGRTDGPAGARGPLVSAIEWICQTLWLGERREPELVELQEERGSLGYPHYILSRVGTLPPERWAEALYVMPPSLVEHLTARCLALDPPAYQAEALRRGAVALRRLWPGEGAPALVELAKTASSPGELAQAWRELGPQGDGHRDALWAAMTLREGRAFVHYRAAEQAGLEPLELLVLTAIWSKAEVATLKRLFRWGGDDLEGARRSLEESGWLTESGELTEMAERGRLAIEEWTAAHTAELLAPLEATALERLLEQLPRNL